MPYKLAEPKKPLSVYLLGPDSSLERGGMSDNLQHGDRFFELLAREHDEAGGERAPSRLKARLYTSFIQRQQESGRLRTLSETRDCGYGLCVFEDLWERVTSTEAAQSFNCCSVCHARVLGEYLERAPIYWGQCPYVAFGKK